MKKDWISKNDQYEWKATLFGGTLFVLLVIVTICLIMEFRLKQQSIDYIEERLDYNNENVRDLNRSLQSTRMELRAIKLDTSRYIGTSGVVTVDVKIGGNKDDFQKEFIAKQIESYIRLNVGADIKYHILWYSQDGNEHTIYY